jgi:hypothetical protein
MRERVIDDDEDDDHFDANGILRDGHRYRVAMNFCDNLQRSVAAHFASARVVDSEQFNRAPITDAHGDPLGLQRPGFRILSGEGHEARTVRDRARDERQSAYEEADEELTNAWRDPITGFGSRGFRGAKAGDLCTIDGSPGHMQLIDGTLRCVPDKRNDAQSPRDELSSAYFSAEAWLNDAWKRP